jgi:uncharacterized membrane protein YgcG
VPAGEAFSERQARDITRTIRSISEESGVEFSVFVGEPDGDATSYAETLHRAMPEPRRSVLVLVAPNARRVEIVTGTAVRNRLTDRDCALAALSMTSAFSGGDLAGGIVTGLRMLADRVRPGRHAHV